MQIIPAIDLQGGAVVRLQQGKFNQVSRYAISPLELVRQYAREGVKYLHVVDLDGAKLGSPQQLAVIAQMQAELKADMQVGGGIRSMADAKAMLAQGVAKIIIGSIALSDPARTIQIITELGANKIVLALDVYVAQAEITLAMHGWQTKTTDQLWDVAAFYANVGITTMLCTDISKDGMLQGPNFDLYRAALERFPNICWQASGGIRNEDDISALAAIGVRAVILGRMLYETNFSLRDYHVG